MIKTSFAAEKAKLKEMNFTEKRQYIWEYYKLHIIVIILLLVLIGSVINNVFINPPKQTYFYIAWLTQHEMPNHPEILAESLTIIVEDPDRQIVLVSSYAITNNPELDIALQSRFFARLQSGDIDGYLLTEEAKNEILEDELVLPVHYIPGDFPTDSSGLAVPLNGSALLAELGIRSDNLYFAVPVSAQNLDRIAKALEALLS